MKDLRNSKPNAEIILKIKTKSSKNGSLNLKKNVKQHQNEWTLNWYKTEKIEKNCLHCDSRRRFQ